MESELDLLAMVEGAISAGARGVAIGRNVFQHENPALITRRICGVVHKGLNAKGGSGNDALQNRSMI